jgi:predicted transposase YbfD/YdcC
MDKLDLIGHFGKVETTREHNGYKHNVGRALAIVILGSVCGLTDIAEIHQWANNGRTRDFLGKHFAIFTIPSRHWFEVLLSIIKPESLNHYFSQWVITLLPEVLKDLTISFDGKTVCSTGQMREYDKPLHILSAHLAEFGLTLGQRTVDEKSNEIPAMRELLKLINVHGCMVVADALHCQTETAEAIISAGADYLLNAKGNQQTLMQDIEDYVQDEELRTTMKSIVTREKNGGRLEVRRSFVSYDISWMGEHLENWPSLASFGAINRCVTVAGKTTNEWHYYISSRKLTPEELLKYARNEWSVETMHWLLDMHFGEDFCKIRDVNLNQSMNVIRKVALNYVRNYKNNTKSKKPLSRLMFACLLECEMLLEIINWI